MFTPRADVPDDYFARLAASIEAADARGMVIGICMSAGGSKPHLLRIRAAGRATRQLTERLRLFGNVIQQV